jgi:membrane-associated protease RseP (regulator of RpoE activity)
VALLLVTFLSTTLAGVGFMQSFRANQPLDVGRDIEALTGFWHHPAILLDGLPFSLTFLTILLAHEMGHYLMCLRYGIDASPPYFLPAPTMIGTFGAFIRIRSPIYTRRALFDVGVAGPIAGFLFLLPALAIGLLQSRVVPGIGVHGDFVFGTPLLLRFMSLFIFPGTPVVNLSLHPVARAACFGILATAINLLPIGQLDGGHVLYSFFGSKHKLLSRIFVVLLVPIGVFYWWGWVIWAVILGLFGLRHPTICDEGPMGETRERLAWLALTIFVLCFTFAPVSNG